MRKNTFKLVFFFIFFLSTMILFTEIQMVMGKTATTSIGIVLDFNDDRVGKVGLTSINMALSDFRNTHPHRKTELIPYTRDSKNDTVLAAEAAMELIKDNEVEAILMGSVEANFIIKLGEKAQVPIISFSTSTSFSLVSNLSQYYFQATRSGANQANATSAILEVFGWREAVVIYVSNEYGHGVIPYLANAFQDRNIRVPYWSALSSSATDNQILEKLNKLKAMPTRVFVVHIFPDLGSRFFIKAKEIGMMEKGYVWILTDEMTNFFNSLDFSVIDEMQGVVGVQPYVPETARLKKFRGRWRRKFYEEHPDVVDAELNSYGLFAYDATMVLASAIEEAGTSNGPNLVRALSNTRFKGLTGEFAFVNQQLQSSAFQVVNMHNGGATPVGFWTPRKGLVRRLNSNTEDSSAKFNLSAIIWPGDSTFAPKGWDIPGNGTRLRIGVPMKNGFREFVNVTKSDDTAGTCTISGYCQQLFEAAMKLVPYAPQLHYIPFDGTYNQLIDQVFNKKYDAVVGDITIIASRSSYIDYTLPYMSSGVTMIVPIKDSETDSAWAFLKPLTWELWFTSILFFIFIALVIWVLEHRINEDFQGPTTRQIGTIFWFSFSTMVFAHRERLVSNLARLVIIIWCFLIFILTQSYTASLTSSLTVQQLQPSITDLNDLFGKKVGYQTGSFVREVLKSLGFEDNQLVPYDSAEKCHQLLSNGTENGGISAAFDELPFVNLIRAQNCRKYTLVDPFTELKIPLWVNTSKLQEFRTDGLGFVFHKGSRLVPDISRAILTVTQGDDIKKLEKRWFNNFGSCGSNLDNSNTLGLGNFWGLFMIAGIVSVLALLICVVMFVYQHKEEVKRSSSRNSLWSRIWHLVKIFFHRKEYHPLGKNGSDHNLPDSNATNAPTVSIIVNSPGEQGATSSENSDPIMQTPTDIGLTSPNQERQTSSARIQEST